MTDRFGVGKATAWRAVQRVTTALYLYRNYFIKWPNRDEALETHRRILDQYGFEKTIGVVDGTHIEVSPSRQDRTAYINRKCFPSIQLQVSNLNLIYKS